MPKLKIQGGDLLILEISRRAHTTKASGYWMMVISTDEYPCDIMLQLCAG